jgi:hypothetical protein
MAVERDPAANRLTKNLIGKGHIGDQDLVVAALLA